MQVKKILQEVQGQQWQNNAGKICKMNLLIAEWKMNGKAFDDVYFKDRNLN